MSAKPPTPQAISPDRNILAAGIEWLYQTEQPDGAIIQHHGAYLHSATRYYGFCPQGAAALPVITLNVKGATWDRNGNLLNPLGEGEMADTARVITELGVTIREQWNGDGLETGSFGLTVPAHPSLVAAVDRYRLQCPVHKTVFCGQSADSPGALGHDCSWYADGNRLMIMPARKEPANA